MAQSPTRAKARYHVYHMARGQYGQRLVTRASRTTVITAQRPMLRDIAGSSPFWAKGRNNHWSSSSSWAKVGITTGYHRGQRSEPPSWARGLLQAKGRCESIADHRKWLVGKKVVVRVSRTTGHGLLAKKGLVARHRVPPVVSHHGTKANMGKSDHQSRHRADRENVGIIASSWAKGTTGVNLGIILGERNHRCQLGHHLGQKEPPVSTWASSWTKGRNHGHHGKSRNHGHRGRK
jgi:hypothetical protein